MNQLKSFADDRLLAACVYCGGATDSRDHCPSRVLLDQPYPENLPQIPCCRDCNAGFSLDEEYVACLVECARTGSVEAVERPKIRRILTDSPALAARLSQARTVADNGQATFSVETPRVRNIALKLARGHAAFELSETHREEPSQVTFAAMLSLSADVRRNFEALVSGDDTAELAPWPEVGSRAMQRMVIAGDLVVGPEWLEVQNGQYRYIATAATAVVIRFVIGEYLACEVVWEHEGQSSFRKRCDQHVK
jgi:hypothetical protein